VNLPNYISMSRIFVIPLIMWILLSNRFSQVTGGKEIFAALLFLVASITDAVDGYLARRRNQITTVGMLLDPLADKLMVTAAFVTLVQFNPRIVPAWMAVIIIGREFLVSGLRSIAAQQGFAIEASDLGKFKMVLQIISVTAAILDARWAVWQRGWFVFPMELIARTSMWAMVALSLWSAGDYFVAFWQKIDRSAQRRRRGFVLSRRKKGKVVAT
jgi:CDP-diacylglycerol--glycerol-3-phosphate 3-phosphatidyltransferase